MSEFADLRRSVTGDTWLDGLVRSSLRAAESVYEGRPPERRLRVHLGGIPDVASNTKIATAVQNATARIAHFQRDSKSSAVRILKEHLEAVPLYPRTNAGDVLEFAFRREEPTQDNGLFDLLGVQTAAEIALGELLAVLPESREDDATLDAVLAHSPAILNAVDDIAKAVKGVGDVRFELVGAGRQSAISVLTKEQADVVDDAITETQRTLRTVEVEGLLDGIRTRRRIFYVLTDHLGSEMSGGFDAKLAEEVKQHLGENVRATIEEIRWVSKSGKTGRPSYRLVGLVRTSELFD